MRAPQFGQITWIVMGSLHAHGWQPYLSENTSPRTAENYTCQLGPIGENQKKENDLFRMACVGDLSRHLLDGLEFHLLRLPCLQFRQRHLIYCLHILASRDWQERLYLSLLIFTFLIVPEGCASVKADSEISAKRNNHRLG